MAAPIEPPLEAVPPSSTPAPARRGRNVGFLWRLQVGANVLIQIALAVFILVAVNGYAYKHFHRFDFSRDRKYALSQRTKQFLGSLTKPIKLIVFMNPQTSPLQGDAANLVEEYRTAQPNFISIEQVDPLRNVTRASEVQTKYKLAQQENVIIVDGGEGHTKIITEDKLAEVDRTGMEYGQPPQITGFTGEQAITSALIEVTEGKKSIIYYAQGHGEEAVGAGKSLTTLGTLFDSDHLATAEVNLLNVEAVPADAGMLIFFGPKYDLSDREIKLLGDYWEKGGRIMILLDPDAATPKLAAFLNGVGIKPDDDRLIGARRLGGNVMGIMRDSYLNATGSTPIAQALAGITMVFPGATQSLTLDAARVAPANVHVEPLLQALDGFWGATDYKNIDETIQSGTGVYFDAAKDKAAPLYVAASVQKGALGDKRVQTNAARMIVVGNSIFVENKSVTEESASFFLNSTNWLLEREALIGIPPKEIKTSSLSLTDNQIQTVFWMSVLAIPGFCLLLGLLVWWRRRA